MLPSWSTGLAAVGSINDNTKIPVFCSSPKGFRDTRLCTLRLCILHIADCMNFHIFTWEKKMCNIKMYIMLFIDGVVIVK